MGDSHSLPWNRHVFGRRTLLPLHHFALAVFSGLVMYGSLKRSDEGDRQPTTVLRSISNCHSSCFTSAIQDPMAAAKILFPVMIRGALSSRLSYHPDQWYTPTSEAILFYLTASFT